MTAKSKQQLIIGILWMLIGLWVLGSTSVWVGGAMTALGIFYLAYAYRHHAAAQRR